MQGAHSQPWAAQVRHTEPPAAAEKAPRVSQRAALAQQQGGVQQEEEGQQKAWGGQRHGVQRRFCSAGAGDAGGRGGADGDRGRQVGKAGVKQAEEMGADGQGARLYQ